MNDQQRLAICELCSNKGFSPKKGVVCTLTSERPAFEDSCADFEEDPKMMAKKRREEEDREKAIQNNAGIGQSLEASHGMNGRIIFGILSIVGAVLWFGLGIALMDRIFFYPIFLVGFGIYKIIDGINNKKREVVTRNRDLLDDDL
ncbi:MAG: hypothetical protein P8P74_14450 [Crocinitomicaceae bacterium]|nr:hypothetical protein [Crocinitomicaceae bacterium]